MIDVVYLGSVTQLIVLLRTGEKLTVHRLNDEVGTTDPRPGEQVTLHWAAEHSYVVGSAPAGADTTARRARKRPRAQELEGARMTETREGTTMATDIGSMSAEQIVADSKRYTLYDWQAQSKASPLAIDRAEGVYMYGADGRRWLDFSSQLMGVNIGHGDKRVTEAIARQAEKLPVHLAVPGVRGSRGAGQAARRAVAGRHREDLLHPGGGRGERERREDRQARDGTAEGRCARYRSYHGSTYGTMMLTGDPRRWPNEQPPMPGVVHVLDPYHGPQRGFDDAQTALALPGGDDRARRPADDRGLHPGDRAPARTAS